MSKHRRTKSNGNYFTTNLENVLDEAPVQTSETEEIIKKIQKQGENTELIVEKLDENQLGMYQGLFRFGRAEHRKKENLNLTTPSEQPPSVLQQRKKGHNHSRSLQMTIQYLEQEIEQMKLQQIEMHTINKFLLKEIHQSRQDYILSQQKNEAILSRVTYLERMLQMQTKDRYDEQHNCSTSDSIEFDEF